MVIADDIQGHGRSKNEKESIVNNISPHSGSGECFLRTYRQCSVIKLPDSDFVALCLASKGSGLSKCQDMLSHLNIIILIPMCF